MKIGELRELSTEDLYQRLKELRAELFSLRIQAAQGRAANPAQIRKVRKNVARIKTLLSERQ
ncbi:MAG: 50S ribosomal protein L29 [bacterium]